VDKGRGCASALWISGHLDPEKENDEIRLIFVEGSEKCETGTQDHATKIGVSQVVPFLKP